MATIQNKYRQKELFKEHNLPVSDHMKVITEEDIKRAGDKFGYPVMLKSCTGGYDGKGNFLIRSKSEIKEGYQALGVGDNLLMAEEFIPFDREISVLGCRGVDGEVVTYPIGENQHQGSILIESKVPADISCQVKEEALKLGREVIELFSGVGIFCIEMFVTGDNRVLINEVAPRPHNSGHYSIEGTVTSQFANHVRAITGLPLGSTDLVKPSVMRNILGEEGSTGEAKVKGIEEALKLPNVKVHNYGKKITRPNRKMGHLTVTADTVEQASRTASEASKLIKIGGD